MNESRDPESRDLRRRGFLKTALSFGAGLVLVAALGGCTSSEGSPEGAIDNPTEPAVTEEQNLEASAEEQAQDQHAAEEEAMDGSEGAEEGATDADATGTDMESPDATDDATMDTTDDAAMTDATDGQATDASDASS